MGEIFDLIESVFEGFSTYSCSSNSGFRFFCFESSASDTNISLLLESISDDIYERKNFRVASDFYRPANVTDILNHMQEPN